MTMWSKGWRDEVWSSLDQPFDLIIIGGGITGGGIFKEATSLGLKTLLVEARDFASGTSSRSSKLVHGGFRYLRNGQIKVTFESVREREHLLREGRGLINELGFVIASYKGNRIPMWVLGAGLSLYDLLAFKWGHKYYPPERILDLCPYLNSHELRGGYRYFDALTDDARLVLKTIKSGVESGGLALNYAPVEKVLRLRDGRAAGIAIRDTAPEGNNRTMEVQARAVINATGAWAEDVRNLSASSIVGKLKIRRLRGSHLVFPQEKLPLSRAISIWHPYDGRPVFAFPWEGVTLVGTTDVDAGTEFNVYPCISPGEVEYLLEFVQFTFPNLKLEVEDIQSTFSGYRPVVDTGKMDPSKESREHILLYENGFLTVAGGKLTTFRVIAHQALNLLRKKIDGFKIVDRQPLNTVPPGIKLFVDTPIAAQTGIRLIGRYGDGVKSMLEQIDMHEFEPVGSSINLWAEIRWAAKSEGIVHLEDLLLRRVRLANLLPDGGLSVVNQVKSIVVDELDWSGLRWDEELAHYKKMLKQCYSINL